jgi:hypothetical protein
MQASAQITIFSGGFMLKKAWLAIFALICASVFVQLYAYQSPTAWKALSASTAPQNYTGTISGGGDTVTYGTFNGSSMYWRAKWWCDKEVPGTLADSGDTPPWALINAKTPRLPFAWNGAIATPGTTAQVGIPTWKNGAKGAYSIHHDDLCDMPAALVQPSIDLSVQYGIPIAWGAITDACDSQDWINLLDMLNKGIEITCHSYNHHSAADQWEWISQDSLVPDTAIDESIPDGWLSGLKVVAKGTSGGTPKTTSVGQTFTVNLTTKKIEVNSAQYLPPDYTILGGVLKLFCMKSWTAADYTLNVDSAKAMIDHNVYAKFTGNKYFPAGKKCEFYIYPYDAMSDSTHKYLDAHGFISARGGSKSGTPLRGDFNHPYYLDFDAYYLINNNPNVVYPANPHQLLSLEGMIDSIIAHHGYMIRELHAVGDPASYWGAVPLALYTAHLQRLQTLQASNDLIVMTPSEAVKYRMSANGVASATISGTPVSYTITPVLTTGITVPDKYKDEICFIVTMPTSFDDAALTKGLVTYADNTHPREEAKKISAKRWAVYANPFKGAFTFSAGATEIKNGPSGRNIANIYSFKNGLLRMTVYPGSYKVVLYTPNGKALRVQSGMAHEAGMITANMDVASLSSGYYILSVEHQNGVTKMPVLINK